MEIIEFIADATVITCKKMTNRNKVEHFNGEKGGGHDVTPEAMYPMVDPHNNGPGSLDAELMPANPRGMFVLK